MPGFHVLPIYGGQSYTPQLNALRRGAHVVVGTPGRVIDHMNRGTLRLTSLKLLVLDEADEMLRMGFVDAVESILAEDAAEEAGRAVLGDAAGADPPHRAAAPASRPSKSPSRARPAPRPTSASDIWMVSGMHKLDALTRILEAETFDAMLVFTRTKQATVELAEKLEARGFAAAALNGDIPQPLRERTVARLKSGDIDILVATDVAARGLDVERIGHVVNYDVPYDTESYVHRVGRTGRAGRKGEAILFIAPRERNLLRAIERATRQPIEPMNLPTVAKVNQLRVAKFKQRVSDTAARIDLSVFRSLLEELQVESGMPLLDIAAALASLAQGSSPLLLTSRDEPAERAPAGDRAAPRPDRAPHVEAAGGEPPPQRGRDREAFAGGRVTYRLEIGNDHGVKPGHIVGAIANESGIDGSHIGRVNIQGDFSTVDLPPGMPKEIFKLLKRVKVLGRELKITRVDTREEHVMSKGMERKKEDKKKPAKTLEEKRALKREKKAAR